MTRLGDILKALADKPASNAADYIVERGEGNGWEYEKWASGHAVLRKSIAKSEPVNTSWGQFNINPTAADFAFYPIEFVEEPILTATALAGHASLICVVTESGDPKTYGPSIHAGRPAGQYVDEKIDMTFQVVARGRYR